ncbi:MAG TPA: helix-turn-helix domain-containing protein [Polyangiaceae bacterium]|nr:helix-turn-helix domain-containing protein [Polyangiaceae bacterium]
MRPSRKRGGRARSPGRASRSIDPRAAPFGVVSRDPRSGAPDARLSRRAFDGVSAEPGVSQAALALRLHRAPSGLSRRFRKDFGIGFVEYRSRIRVMRFIEAVDSGKSVVRAALDVEFGSYVQCHRVFRRALGCSPTDYFAGARHAIDAATSLS